MTMEVAEKADDGVKHSQPIPISTRHFRHRSSSVSSESSSSPTSPPHLQTPQNISPPRIPTSSPSSSPLLYFLSQSPAKSPTNASFPFRGFAPPPVFEDEYFEELPATAHARRASTTGRFNPQAPAPEAQQERGVNLLRRLSLGSALAKPPATDIPRSDSPPQLVVPPNSAVTTSPVAANMLPGRKSRRSATITEPGRHRRAPSPMGERILKGHFDGFN
ncbi:hypothetical protein HYDPIDRAFT_174290 [Hydnomerulius pinastri MD-312]|nr:hypothetical protein HYDPIDRAFT_174290 [Hydnomerulius pinastri MD-312]